MKNVLSVDVEDYFQVEAFAARVHRDSWNRFECRVERNVERVLELFAKHQAKATFFVLGWVAERYPQLVSEIAAAGHEIGSHGYGHQRIHRLTPEEFRADISRARSILAHLSPQPVTAYRAPSFSITQETLWALDILVEQGMTVDSSVFPVRHDFYGIPDAPRFPHRLTTPQGKSLVELPPSTIRVFKNNVGIAGGGYLRLFPSEVTRRAIRHVNVREKQPVIVYFHPWEIDIGQPRIRASWRSRLRHYTNLSRMETKIGQLLQEFQFAPLCEVLANHRAIERRGPDRPKITMGVAGRL